MVSGYKKKVTDTQFPQDTFQLQIKALQGTRKAFTVIAMAI